MRRAHHQPSEKRRAGVLQSRSKAPATRERSGVVEAAPMVTATLRSARFVFLLLTSSAGVGCAAQAAVAPQMSNAPLAAPPPEEETRVVHAFFEAYGSRSPEAFGRFVETYQSRGRSEADRARIVAQYPTMYAELGPLTLRDVTADAHGVTALAHSEREGWLAFRFFFEAPPPHALVGERTSFAAAPAGAEREPYTDEEIAAAVDTYLRRRVAGDRFSGVVVVAHDGKPIVQSAWSWANREAGVPNTLDTTFSLASVSKMFTAVAVMQLAEERKLSLEDPIGKYLPFPAPGGDAITIARLLSHTSGLGGYDLAHPALKSTADYEAQLRADPPAFPPGHGFRYSNLGFVLLGEILERASGERWDAYVSANVLARAKMTSCSVAPAGPRSAAVGYTRRGPDGQPSTDRVWNAAPYAIVPNPAGNGVARAVDLLRFGEALVHHELLGEDTTRTMLAPRTKVDAPGAEGEEYAYGFSVRRLAGVTRVGHDGVLPGVNAYFEVMPELGYTIVVLANKDAPAATWVGERIASWIARAHAADARPAF